MYSLCLAICNTCRYRIAYYRTQTNCGAAFIRVDGVREQNDAAIQLRVNDDARSREARVAVGLSGEQVTVARGIGAVAIPTISASEGLGKARNRAKQLRCLFAHDAFAIPFSIVLEHGTEDGDVLGRTEESGVTADATIHNACQWIVHHAAKHAVSSLFRRWSHDAAPILAFSHQGGPARQVCVVPHSICIWGTRYVVGVVHSEWLEDLFA